MNLIGNIIMWGSLIGFYLYFTHLGSKNKHLYNGDEIVPLLISGAIGVGIWFFIFFGLGLYDWVMRTFSLREFLS